MRASMKPIDLPPEPSVLVVALRRLGDVLLTTPLIRSVHRAWPGAKIDALVFAGTAAILQGNPDIHRIIAMPERPTVGETGRLIARLWRRYDLAISTQTGDRPALFALLGGRVRAGLVPPQGSGVGGAFKRLGFRRWTPIVEEIHRVEQMLRIADALGIARVGEVVPPAAAPAQGAGASGTYAVIHAAPMYRYKQWTRDGWRALAAGLADRGLSVIAIGGPDESERRYLEHVWQGVATVHQARWPHTVSLLSAARVYVGPDTAVSHLAAATGCPTVALFGPMDPRIWGPWPRGGLATPWLSSARI